ncbi:MAG: aspartate--tRNA ligase [Flavobacteriales bacterium]|nr:aspartate--tRNA ligase [Flavobacteriales bacterium]
MLRSHHCGELRMNHLNKEVTLCGWVQKSRDLGGLTFIDLRDRYGITQLTFNMEDKPALCKEARALGREYVIQVKGTVRERSSKNLNILTGEIEVDVDVISVLNASKTPPFTIEDETDGGEELRMKYRYLDLRRKPVQDKILLRSKIAQSVRNYLANADFIEIETPYLIKSTPEGARDFVVPSRMNEGQFYALPQSPQTFKQLLMVSGYDKYFQIVKCFRDEDLRADRQPEFTQIDCEMSFVEQEDVLNTFEKMVKTIFKEVKQVDLPVFPRMTYADAMKKYGSDKPDIRFGMEFYELNHLAQGKGFKVFDEAELVVGINVKGAASYSRKQLDALTKYVQTPQVGAKGLVYVKLNEDGTIKSSVDKFYTAEQLQEWANGMEANKGDLLLIISGKANQSRFAMNSLRLHLGNELGLRPKDKFAPLWVIDFPLLEQDEETGDLHAMHHPFTSPKAEDVDKLSTTPTEVRANAYDMVINGVELGGGSIRISQKEMQQKMLRLLGFSDEEAKAQFGFLMDAFEYGTPPHGGIAFGFDRLCALIGGTDSIRDYIAFPKNNAGRDVMIDAPAKLDEEQMKELGIKLQSN